MKYYNLFLHAMNEKAARCYKSLFLLRDSRGVLPLSPSALVLWLPDWSGCPKPTSQQILSLPSFPGSGAHFFPKGQYPYGKNSCRFVPGSCPGLTFKS